MRGSIARLIQLCGGAGYERASAPNDHPWKCVSNPLRVDPFRHVCIYHAIYVCVYIMLYMWVIAPRAASRSRSRLLPLRDRRGCCGLPIIREKLEGRERLSLLSFSSFLFLLSLWKSNPLWKLSHPFSLPSFAKARLSYSARVTLEIGKLRTLGNASRRQLQRMLGNVDQRKFARRG